MIKAVIFDAGEVIHYRDGKTLRPITDFLKKKGYNISPDKLKKAYDEDVLSAYKGKISKDEHLKKILEFLKIRYNDNFFTEFANIFREYFSTTKLTKNIPNVFEIIKSMGIKIAILTDTFSTEEKRWEWFKNNNLAHHIDYIFCSSVTGHTKDEKEAYETVLQRLNLKPDEVIFVGHKKYEMQGAKLGGIKSVSLEKGVGGDYYIKGISEILELIKKF